MTERDVFIAALQQEDQAQRRAYLDGACAGRPELREQVEGLLRLHEGAGSFLERPAGEAAAPATGLFQQEAGEQAAQPEAPGTVLGPYKLVEPIGEGGMGTVWMAQQTEPIRRLVAVKLIKAGMDSRQVVARFEQERQALALMDHPNIARVLDAGATAAGRPYFVMELVKGVPITRYCDEHHLTLRQRLELFASVCHAIQHAHQKGVIHRDVKPSNVLVARHDDLPVPKVIDFGVAKATGQQLTEKTLVTGFGSIVGTLEYVSPEQAEFNQLDVDTRSDVYSLGVLLYELLTGSTPFSRKESERGGVLEMLRVIREQEPTKPSAKLSTAEGLPALAASRGTEPAKLTKLVRGELDWIVMKALDKDRNRRYETANDFALDVQRYLHDEPVLACPPSPWYRLRKTVRRHRGPALAVSLVLLALVAGIIGTTASLLWALQERDVKAKALRAETKEREGKENALAAEIGARDLAVTALLAMTDEFVGNQMMAGGTQLTEKDKAFLRKILALFEVFAASTATDVESQIIRAAGQYRVGVLRHRLGESQEAEEAYGNAVALFERLAADFPTRPALRQDLSRCHNSLGVLLSDTGRLKEAEKAYADALALRKQLTADFPASPEVRRDLAASHRNLGVLLKDMGRLKEAEAAHADALTLRKQLAADFPRHPEFRQELATSHNSLGRLFRATGRLKEAEAAHADALALRKQLAADFPSRPEFRRDLAASHRNLANLLSDTGRRKEAEKAYVDALALLQPLAADFPSRPEFRRDLASSHSGLGVLFHDMRRLKEAAAAHADALALRKQLAADFPRRPEFRQELAASHNNVGNLLSAAGHPKEAEAAQAAALALRKQLAADFPTQPEFRSDLAKSHYNLGILLLATGRPKEAEAAYATALALFERLAADFPTQPEFRSDLAKSHHNLGNLLSNTGRRKEAEKAYAAAVALLKPLAADFPTQPEFRSDLARSHHNLGRLLSDTDRPKEAEKAHADALALRTQLAADFPTRLEFRRELAQSHNSLGILFRVTGRLKDAETAYAETLALQKRLAAEFPNTPDVRNDLAGTCVNLALLRLGQRDYEAAKAYLDEAGPHHQAALKASPRHPNYRQYYRNNLVALIRANACLGDRAGAKQAAEKVRDLGWDPPGNAYDAARCLALCILVVQGDDQATKGERDKQVAFYGDEAMKMLRVAVARGYKADEADKDPGFSPLRQREDFAKLVAELEAKVKKEKN